ncbi:MAG TPA: sigma-70 family RNA polymerase sigma factor [Thermoanaerobaculia bacterium]|nr:sigma-70 family RNA polymerase sigma factor [Thermoanaerobaculia bacterium]
MQGVDVSPAEESGSDSFRTLVEEHSPMVFRLAYRMTDNEEDAEDVVQESFLKAHRAFGRFDARSSFGTWIYRIAVNCAIDLIRRRHRGHVASLGSAERDAMDVVESLPSSDPLPDQVAFSGQVERSVASALLLLSPLERAAFVLRHIEGLPIDRIATVLQSRPNAVKQTVFRAVRKLRHELAPLMGAS